MQELTQNDLSLVLSRVPSDIRELMKSSHLVLGGGFIRSTIAGEKPNDIDLFGSNWVTMDSLAEQLASRRLGRVHETDNAFTVLSGGRLPVQFISRWLYPNPEKVVESFDFTVCQAVIFWEVSYSWRSWIASSFYSDLAARRLVYTSPIRNEDAGGSLMRVRKFLSRGYKIQAGDLAKVVARLVSKVRMEEVHGEEDLARIIASLLREVDPLTVLDGFEIAEESPVDPPEGE